MQPNVIWITLDSVRADHTTLGGYRRDTTPELTRIADRENGWHSDRCIAAGTGTTVSTGSILTGTYPFRHGVGIHNQYLPDSLDTAPELFRDAGYTTACLSRNSYLSSGTGLDRGFDRFEWIAGSTILDAVPPGVLARYLLNVRRHSAGLTVDTAKHATPFLLNETAKRWLASMTDSQPFFFYLHYNEPHRPYYPPRPYLERFTDDIRYSASEAAAVSMEIHRNAHEHIADGLSSVSSADLEALTAMYDAEVAYTDEMIGRLFEHVRSADFGETIVVVTADHGELLGEHGLLSHKVVVDEAVTNVPLVVHGPQNGNGEWNWLRESNPSDPVQHIDVMQTVLERIGADTGQFDGIDLQEETRNYAFVNRDEFDFDLFRQFNPSYDASGFHESPLVATVGDGYRYERSEDFERLYRLPDERTDVSTQEPEITDRMRQEVIEWEQESGQPVRANRGSQLDETMRQQLRDLGYVE
ncbi:MAG: sulfatase [Salinirussus sp.]